MKTWFEIPMKLSYSDDVAGVLLQTLFWYKKGPFKIGSNGIQIWGKSVNLL